MLRKLILCAGILGALLPQVLTHANVEKNLNTFSAISQCIDLEEAQKGCRLVIKDHYEGEYFGAQSIYHAMPTNETILEYENKQEAQEAYQKLSSEYDCYLDFVLSFESYGSDLGDQDLSERMTKAWCDMGLIEKKDMALARNVRVAIVDSGLNDGVILPSRVDKSSMNFIGGEKETDLADATWDKHGSHIAKILYDLTPENTNFLICKVLENNNTTSAYNLRLAFQYAIAQNVDIINISFGQRVDKGEKNSLDLDDLIEEAIAKNIIVCAAAGNENMDLAYSYPQNNHKVITVGCVKYNAELGIYQKWQSSNYGKLLDFVAPGTDIYYRGLSNEGMYEAEEAQGISGTSFSCPAIVACFAYLKAYYPGKNNTEYVNLLKSSCQDLGLSGKDIYYGWGMPNMASFDFYVPDQMHTHQYELITSEEASCTESGQVVYLCKECQDLSNREAEYRTSIKALGHRWSFSMTEEAVTCVCSREGCREKRVFLKNAWQKLEGTNLAYKITVDENQGYELSFSGQGILPYAQQYPWDGIASKITRLQFEDGITVIGEMEKPIFFAMENLKELSLPASLQKLGYGNFAGCPKLQRISLPLENQHFSVMQTNGYDALLDKSGKKLYLVSPYAEIDLEGIDEIYPYAFYQNRELDVLCIDHDIRIHPYAFAECDSLYEISLLASDSLIDQDAFYRVVADLYYDQSLQLPVEKKYGRTITVQNKYILSKDTGTCSATDLVFTIEKYDPVKGFTISDVRYKNGEILKKDVDYYVLYTENDKPDNEEAIGYYIKGIGKYAGILRGSFLVKKGAITFDQVIEDLFDGLQVVGNGETNKTFLQKYEKWKSVGIIKESTFEDANGTQYKDYFKQCGKLTISLELRSDNPYYNMASGARMKYSLFIHNIQKVKAKAATCTENGKRAYQYCTVCKKYFDSKARNVYHDAYTENESLQNGQKNFEVSMTAREISALTIAKLGHNYSVAISKASLTKNGSIIKKCTRTGCSNTSKTILYYPKTFSLAKKIYTYNGKAQKPAVKVISSSGTILANDKYSLIYEPNCTAVGKHTVKITMKGNYTGTKLLEYRIVPKNTNITKLLAYKNKFIAYYAAQKQQTSGYEIQYSLDASFKNSKTVKVTKNSIVKQSVAGLQSRKKYYVRIRTYKTVNGTAYPSSWSDVKSVNVK